MLQCTVCTHSGDPQCRRVQVVHTGIAINWPAWEVDLDAGLGYGRGTKVAQSDS